MTLVSIRLPSASRSIIRTRSRRSASIQNCGATESPAAAPTTRRGGFAGSTVVGRDLGRY